MELVDMTLCEDKAPTEGDRTEIEITPGGPDLAPIVRDLQAAGARSLRAIAAGLNERGIKTPRGRLGLSTRWHRTGSRIFCGWGFPISGMLLS